MTLKPSNRNEDAHPLPLRFSTIVSFSPLLYAEKGPTKQKQRFSIFKRIAASLYTDGLQHQVEQERGGCQGKESGEHHRDAGNRPRQ